VPARTNSECVNRQNFNSVLCVVALVTVVVSFVGCGGNQTSTQTQLPASALDFVSSPPSQGNEGNTYTYSLNANIQGAAFALTSAPSGATLAGNTITWTPSTQQARTANKFTVTAMFEGVSKTQSWTVTPTGTIRGTTATTCLSDSGQQTLTFVNPLQQGAQPTILVPNAAGTFDTHVGTLAQDGTFSIANVPAGPFWVKFLFNQIWTNSNVIDMGSRSWGGCKQESASSSGTSLQISVEGLSLQGGYLQFAVPNERSGLSPPPWPSGATSLTLNIPSNNLLLFDAANGDNAYFTQLVNASYGGISFLALQQYFGPMPITIQNGLPNTFTVTLQPRPMSSVISANIKGSAFAALYPNISRNATAANPSNNFRVDISPDMSAPLSNGLFLVLGSHGFSSDFDAGDIAFANPFPAEWTPYLHYQDIALQQLTPPGASSPFPVVLLNEVKTSEFPTADKPISPLVGPVLNPQINGASLFQDQVIIGTTPTLSWQPPALGPAYIYRVQVQQFVVTNGTPSVQLSGLALYTTDTSMTMPPGILSSGKSYFVMIESLYRNEPAGSTVAPFKETFPEGEADLISGVITVQ
jgi:hypothetical protein